MSELNLWSLDCLDVIWGSDDEFPVTREVLPQLPAEMTSENIIIDKGVHDYETWRVDLLSWKAAKREFGSLGIAILATLFEGQDCKIVLTNPASQIRTLQLVYPLTENLDGLPLSVQAQKFRYFPESISIHPWAGWREPPLPSHLPFFKLTNQRDILLSEEDRSLRDTVQGFGTLQGSVRLAQLMLDLSHPENDETEVSLECEAGWRGVAQASSEVRFHLIVDNEL